MRPILTAAGTLALAATMAIGLAAPASAAHGQLVLSGQVIENPSGCHAGQTRPLTVQNNTDEYVLVHAGPACDGEVLEVIAPGDTASGYAAEFGQSVHLN
ncbi:hypothetical protein [Streptomyces sp. NPDC020965]|uniref:hypothetical protein n=1 Tax=Streptomyces sp. NPDC020965 TaxID=3365105 RepID=UPI0037B76390